MARPIFPFILFSLFFVQAHDDALTFLQVPNQTSLQFIIPVTKLEVNGHVHFLKFKFNLKNFIFIGLGLKTYSRL